EARAAPADELALGVLVLELEADLEPLDFGPAVVQVLLVAVHHARGDGLAAGEQLADDGGQLLGRAAEGAQQVGLAVAVVPPFAAAVGLVPPVADAGLAGAAVVDPDGALARLGPVHLRLPLVGAQPAAADVVLDDLLRVLALHVADLAVDDQVLLAVHLLDAHEQDVGGLGDDGAEA